MAYWQLCKNERLLPMPGTEILFVDKVAVPSPSLNPIVLKLQAIKGGKLRGNPKYRHRKLRHNAAVPICLSKSKNRISCWGWFFKACCLIWNKPTAFCGAAVASLVGMAPPGSSLSAALHPDPMNQLRCRVSMHRPRWWQPAAFPEPPLPGDGGGSSGDRPYGHCSRQDSHGFPTRQVQFSHRKSDCYCESEQNP